MLKKIALFIAASALFAGCTTVDSTQKFNAVDLGNKEEKAVCQTYVEISGYCLFGLPLIVGSAKGDGQFTFFRFNLTNENVVYLLTRAVKAHGATRMINVHVNSTNTPTMFPFLSYCTIQGSGTGVRSKSAAMKQVQQEFAGF
jgi:hypothetical protein